jgi:aryl-alcohol dehydrogenase-like predicted oxidoreductase
MQYRTISGTRVSALCLGAMIFGTSVDEKTSFTILDRFVEAGGTFIDTSDNYAFWLDGATGDESETVLGHWLERTRARDHVVIGSKVGARPRTPGDRTLNDVEGLSAAAISAALAGSLERLGTDHVDVYYTHVEDRSVPLEETVETLGDLVRDGSVGALGVSNHALWRVERARGVARSQDAAAYTFLQYRYSYLQPRSDHPLPESAHVHVSNELLDYLRSEPDTALVAYSPLIMGAYTRADRPLSPAYDHPGTRARLDALTDVAAETGATPNQVVLAWMLGSEVPIVPLVGVSSLAQLDEALGAVDLHLTDGQRERLDAAR